MRKRLAVLGMCLVAATLTMCVGPAAAERASKSRMKVGVYDSRGVAIACARSPESGESVARLRADYDRARAEGDSALLKKLGQQGPWMQVRLHQRGFSTAGVGDLLAKVADALPGVARDAGVVLIVSKWEMPYQDASVEVVDVTLPIARLFKPDEQTLKILGELKDQKPIPFDEVPLDAND
jgi:hypothetical protein